MLLSGIKFPNQASSISIISKGPTAGLLNVSDISEDKPGAAATETVAEQNDENNEVTYCQTVQLLQISQADWSAGNEDKNASLDLFMKTSNPTLIQLTELLCFKC